ncbi:MAG: polyphenol oxidase family protein [Propionibacteriaceae bacterium]|jgi:YfiH family protein|nr:polyphenol oxidase family protein [Propionibacteriaceae bacterium]
MILTRGELLPGVQFACTDRDGGVSAPPYGSLNLGKSGADDPRRVQRNFQLVRQELGVETTVTTAQVHGTQVLDVDAAFLSRWHPGSEVGDDIPGQARLARADAMVTAERGVALAIRIADCVPVLFAAPGVVGAAHAGRVGLLAGVLDAAVAAMRRHGAGAITAWIGPHICGRCYEVPEVMATDAWACIPATKARTRSGTPAIDLGAGVAAELERLGCQVAGDSPCTFETPSLFSHRRNGPETGRQSALIWR